MNTFNGKPSITPPTRYPDLSDVETRAVLQAYKTQQKHEPRPTQAELEAACKAGRAEYDRNRNTAPKGWNAV